MIEYYNVPPPETTGPLTAIFRSFPCVPPLCACSEQNNNNDDDDDDDDNNNNNTTNRPRNIEAEAVPSYVKSDADESLEEKVEHLGMLADDAEARGIRCLLYTSPSPRD